MKSRRRRPEAALLIFGAVAALTLLAVLDLLDFALTTDGYFGKDEGLHMAAAAVIHQCGWNWLKVLAWYRSSNAHSVLGGSYLHYPPLTYLVSSVFLAGDFLSLPAAVYASRAAWLVALVASLFWAGRRLGGGTAAGLTAGVLGALNAVALSQARDVSLEFPTMVAVSVCLAAYYATDDVRRRGRVALLGGLNGLALLTKPSAAFFLGPFFLAAFLAPSDRVPAFSRERIRGALLALSAAFLVAGTFYLPLLRSIWHDAGAELANPERWSPALARQYVLLSRRVFIPPLVLALAAGSILFGLGKGDRALIPLVAAGIGAAPFILMAKSPGHTYLFPYQVLNALLVVRGLRRLPARVGAAAGLALSLLYAWPVSAGLARLELESKPAGVIGRGTVLRYVYPGFAGPLLLGPGRPRDTPWEPVWLHYRLFVGKYENVHYGDLTIVNRGEGQHAIIIALALSRPDDAWNTFIDWSQCACTAHPRDEDRQSYYVGSLTIVQRASWPGAGDDWASPEAVELLKRLTKGGRVDFRYRASPSGPGLLDEEFYVRAPPSAAPGRSTETRTGGS